MNVRGFCNLTACPYPVTKTEVVNVKKTMTNADRIRSMTDEELAKELWAWNQTCCHKWKMEEVLTWLKQEAADEKT